MTFIPHQQEKHCFIACSEDKVNAGLCDCINRMRKEALRQPLVIFSIKNFIHMKKELTKKDYDNYMKVVNQNIKETERRLEILDKTKKVSQLSFEDWVKFQNGELKIS